MFSIRCFLRVSLKRQRFSYRHKLPVPRLLNFGLLSESKRQCWPAFSSCWCKADLPGGQLFGLFVIQPACKQVRGENQEKTILHPLDYRRIASYPDLGMDEIANEFLCALQLRGISTAWTPSGHHPLSVTRRRDAVFSRMAANARPQH
ncbi:hypothetical protein MnTg02_02266 [bacterium MnTg02]|nr:hypothetical protein MnTg02_02266 [bacterium MnTg02]